MVAVVVLLTLACPHKGIGKRDHRHFFGSVMDPVSPPPPPPPPIKKGENTRYARNKYVQIFNYKSYLNIKENSDQLK
jgi:hypothetical protein